jgi:hypothetical protein
MFGGWEAVMYIKLGPSAGAHVRFAPAMPATSPQSPWTTRPRSPLLSPRPVPPPPSRPLSAPYQTVKLLHPNIVITNTTVIPLASTLTTSMQVQHAVYRRTV